MFQMKWEVPSRNTGVSTSTFIPNDSKHFSFSNLTWYMLASSTDTLSLWTVTQLRNVQRLKKGSNGRRFPLHTKWPQLLPDRTHRTIDFSHLKPEFAAGRATSLLKFKDLPFSFITQWLLAQRPHNGVKPSRFILLVSQCPAGGIRQALRSNPRASGRLAVVPINTILGNCLVSVF